MEKDKVYIGSIFTRSEALFRNRIEEIIRQEALPLCADACSIQPAALGESLGDVAAICVAVNGVNSKYGRAINKVMREVYYKKGILKRLPN
jgi:glucokinase